MTLRVHTGDIDRPANPAAVTLRECYELYLRPSKEGRRAKSTTTAYSTAIGHWERFVAERASIGNTRALESVPLVDPIDLVSQISDAMLNDWGQWLMADDGAQLSLGTAEKQWRHVSAILSRVGPSESGKRRSLGYLDRVPVMDPLHELATAVTVQHRTDLPDEHISRIYEACEIATWPGDHSPLQWRTYVVLLACMGPRVNDAATLGVDHFRLDPSSPIKNSTGHNDAGWLIYRPTKTARKKTAELIIPMLPVVRSHIDALMARRGGRLFGWRSSRMHSFRSTWQQIVEQAGLPHVERRAFRETANARWDRARPGKELGHWVLGHAARDVNAAHYRRIEPDLIDAVPDVQVPEAFELRADRGAQQTFLF